jgi:tetratricopeptide (TPR) repeat protein
VLDAVEADYVEALTASSQKAPRLLATLAEAARSAGLNDRAEQAYKRYQRDFPASEYGFRELGALYHEQDRLEEAQASLELATEVKPNISDSWLELADVYLEREMDDAAASALDTANRLSPFDARSYQLRAQLDQQQGDLAQAAINLHKSLFIAESIPGQLALADLDLQLNQIQHSAAECRQASVALIRTWTRPLDPLLWQIGECFSRDANGQPLSSPNALSSISSSNWRDDGTSAEIRQILDGHKHRAQGQLDQALVAYQAAATIRPDESGPHYFLGETYQALGQLQLAEAEYRLAAQLNPLESLPLMAIGRMQWGLGKQSEALASYSQAVEATPGWGESHMVLGNTLFTLDDRKGASTQYQLAQLADGDIHEGVLYDFTAHLAETSLQPKNANTIHGDYFTINGERKRVLFTHPDAHLEYVLDLTGFKNLPRLELTFDVGMSPDSWTKEGDGVSFSVYVISDRANQKVFSTYIDPKSNLNDRHWHPFTVNLSQYIGQNVTLVFETGAGPVGDYRFDWAGWGEPRLLKP